MKDDFKNIWPEACNQLKNILSEDIYERWIAVIQCREISDNKLCLIVANDFYQSWLEENYLPMIRKAITAVSGRDMEISLSVETKYPHDGDVKVRFDGKKPTQFKLRLRIPGWCNS